MSKRNFLLVLFLMFSFIVTPFLNAQEPTTAKEDDEPEIKRSGSQISCKEASLVTLLNMIAENAEINIIIPDEVDRKVSFQLDLNKIDAMKLLEILLTSYGYELKLEDREQKLYRVVVTEASKRKEVKETPKTKNTFQLTRIPVEEAEMKIRGMLSPKGKMEVNRKANAFYVEDTSEALKKVSEYVDFLNIDPAPSEEVRFVTRVFKIYSLEPTTVEETVKKFLSERGKAVYDKQTRTLSVTDIDTGIAKVEQFLSVADRPEPQIYIRTHFIEVNLTNTTKMGGYFTQNNIEWDDTIGLGSFNFLPNTAKPFGVNENTGALVPGQPDNTLAQLNSPKNNLEGRFSAQARRDNYRVLSSPNLLCHNRETSKIEITTQLPYIQATTTTDQGLTTQTVEFKDVGIKLEVTPEMTEDGYIKLKVKPEVSENTLPAASIPVIKTKKTDGVIRVKDGDNIIMGGLLEDQMRKVRYKIPLLGDIPFVGLLFSRNEQEVIKTELMIFLHITIVDDSKLKSLSNKAWQHQEKMHKDIDGDSGFEFYPHVKQDFEPEKLNMQKEEELSFQPHIK